MADFSQPLLTTQYTTYHSNMLARDVDAYTLAESPTNPPTGAIRYNRSLNKFQEWSGAAWVDKVISLAGGGTGGIDAASARTSLGLGTMAVQNNNAVNITGGSASGLTSLGVTGDSTLSGRVDIGSTAANALDVAGGITAGTGNVGIINTAGKIPALSPTYIASLTATGNWVFSGTLSVTGNVFTLEGTGPELIVKDTDAVLDEKFFRILGLDGDILFQAVNDAYSSGGTVAIALRRTANTFTLVEFGTNIQLPASGQIRFAGINTEIQGDDNFAITLLPTAAGVTSRAVDAGFEVGSGGAHPRGSAVAGCVLTVGRNSTGGGAPGVIQMVDKAATAWYLWVDTTGDLRISTSAPVEGASDTSGTVVGTQS